MQAGACCSFEWALTALVGHQFQPKLPTGTTHHCAFCLKKHRRGETAASDLIPCPRKVPSNSSYTVMLALPGKFLLLLCRLPSPSEVFIKYSSLEEVVLCSKEEKGDNWLVQEEFLKPQKQKPRSLSAFKHTLFLHKEKRSPQSNIYS
ncbi:uncharacterized protein LOC117200819 isoform X3 [Orcinus orca]|uniref:uncharacterized protein LOC117200819 isoform X3 n=1 Tax=Orcinus orca TaxID=9733 RepID=UPI002111CF74|nr:uncharacterized protein LOC117200819 isoform X3 [Orcinus orca]